MNKQEKPPDDALDLKVLVIDDNEAEARSAAEAIERIGCECRVATSGAEGLETIRAGGLDLILTDLVMRDVSGLEIVAEAKKHWPDVEVIVITGHGSIDTAIKATQAGAMMYLEKPLNLKVLRTYVRKAAERQTVVRDRDRLKRALDKRFGYEGIVGRSEAMQRVFDTLRQIAPTRATVLIEGESGTGKELVARALHNNSPRRARPFVALNCAALSEGILESELFGHEKGAFTGADARRDGRFEYAHQGTLFLDEIGDMPMSTQIKLLRVIEQGEIFRVGSNVPIRVDVRLIAATNQDMAGLVARKRFREDLYFRLNVVRLRLPPLRERPEDVPLLADYFLQQFREEHRKDVTGITPEALRRLEQYPWPGNVREMRNCIEAMVVTASSPALDAGDIPAYIGDVQPAPSGPLAIPAGVSLDEMEKEMIRGTLERTGGNREEAARILKIGERTLYRKLDKYGLK